jgi:hypothetical protein
MKEISQALHRPVVRIAVGDIGHFDVFDILNPKNQLQAGLRLFHHPHRL